MVLRKYLYQEISMGQPDSPVYPPGETLDAPPGGPPPSYDHNSAKPLQSEKTGASTGEQMFGGSSGPGASTSHQDLTADEQLARKLQAEEDARAHGGSAAGSHRGEADGYYQGAPGASPYGQQPSYGDPGVGPGTPSYDQQPAGGKSKGGLFGKLLGKGKSHQQQQPQYGYPQQQQGYPPQQPYGYPQQQGHYGQGGYPPQQYAQPGRKPGMGAGGAAALGLGGGLLGGVLLGEALSGDGGDGGGDYGGGDDGGGGGDFGGGDF